jgi:alkylation response protein AidB-like acyl-CoA dehydrogenase
MFTLTDEQRLLVDATQRYLRKNSPLRGDGLGRAGAQGGAGAQGDPEYWRRGADLGWTSVVAEAGRAGQFTDLVLLAREFGRAVAAGPFGPVNVAAAALARSGGSDCAGLLGLLAEGRTVATWVNGAAVWGTGGSSITAERGYVLDGVVSPVEAAPEAEYFLVSTADAHAFLVHRDQPGVSVTPLRSLDLHRTYGTVTLDRVRVPAGALVGAAAADPDLADWLLDLAVLVQLAEIVGAMEWALDITVKWTFDRYSFGRPLAAYQAIQHRAADMEMWLEASRAITADAAGAFDADAPERSELISAAKAYVGRYGPELLQECIQFHGGIGVTAEHDLHLYLRRVAADAATHGTPREHAMRLGRILEARAATS